MNTRARILVVDDDHVTRELFKMILERAGYEVILAEDGAAAIRLASSQNPDVVITDGLLPKLHGFLVCKSVKELNPASKVIVVTGIYTKPTYKWEVKAQYHADDLLTKPVTPGELIDCVEKHLATQDRPEARPDKPGSLSSPSKPETGRGPAQQDTRSTLFTDGELNEILRGWAVPAV